MNRYNVPEYFLTENTVRPEALIVPYQTHNSTTRNRVVMSAHMFSFVTEGSKEIVTGNTSLRLDKSEFALVTAGKCFTSEKLSAGGQYSATLFFFDNGLLQEFFETQKDRIGKILDSEKLSQKEILLFPNDDFIRSYVQSLKFLPRKSAELARIKLWEIFLYLLETDPVQFCCLFADSPKISEEINFRNIIASHIDSNLSVSELAYLCNVSLSTFKRKFEAVYHDSPTNWIRQKRMEHAAFLLKYNKERVSDIYLRLGYENHSSFSQSFKTVFGVSPKQYQVSG